MSMGRGRGVNNAPAWQTGTEVAAPPAAAAAPNPSARFRPDGGGDRDGPGGRQYGNRAPNGQQYPPPPPAPEEGSVHDGTVKSVHDFGVFLRLPGFQHDAMCHVSQISTDRVEHPKDALSQGDTRKCLVTKVEPSTNRDGRPGYKISASISQVDQSTGERLEGGGGGGGGGFSGGASSSEPPELSSIHADCLVHSVQDYGIFLAIPGFSTHAMAHVSELTHDHLEHPSGAFNQGDKVWCKITKVEPSADRQGRPSWKVSASVKAVDQHSGRDIEGEVHRGGGGGEQAEGYMEIQGSSADPVQAMMNASRLKLKDDGNGRFGGYDLAAKKEKKKEKKAAKKAAKKGKKEKRKESSSGSDSSDSGSSDSGSDSDSDDAPAMSLEEAKALLAKSSSSKKRKER
ncbi:hypothetical protein TeGR_g918 [Tetraparma gracilis]|uniref:S1 motif domain-containing protein n=1 Tax=Tetraparma gracilis TaxID=2962635 RepID=A0ABQ6MXT5_9STRA|nr:hypothetical protein TeGR_g918 [Tetraparma gracilis]